jgi:glycosyltransferase involved in cell wall biosynthesis
MGTRINHLSSPSAQQPLVTVVTPSFNQGQFIEATICSVLEQDYPAIEYIVMDGGSTDGTIDILRRYSHRLTWVSAPDRGQADAINRGWQRSRGQILAWLNSDDTYLAGAVTAQVAALMAHPDVGVVYGDAIFTDQDGRPLHRYHARPFDRKRFLHLSAIPQPSAFFRRGLLMRHGGLNARFQYALDYELFLRLMWETTFLYTGTLVATYRLHDTSKTVDGYDCMLSEAIAVVRTICRQHSAELSGIMPRATSDWYWEGAIRSVEARKYRKALRYSLCAVLEYPLRPRAGTFFLTLFDAIFKTNTSDWLVSKLDRRSLSSYRSQHL